MTDGPGADTTLAEVTRAHRGELVGLAYRLLGSVSEAEDAVQEGLLRLQRHGLAGVERPGAWLNRVVSRICLDRLGSARHRRETYIGPWLPEPLVHDDTADVELAESLTTAFLLVLESLTPAQRVAYVLHEAFDVPYAEIAEVLGRSEEACRQLAARGRAAIADARPRPGAAIAEARAVVETFQQAARDGDLDTLTELLADDVVLVSDGGGLVSAARRPLHGADAVARFLAGIAGRIGAVRLRPATVNGRAGVVVAEGRDVIAVFAVDVHDDRITRIDVVRNPEKLRHVRSG